MGFRLLSNRYGFPVDENDGNILIDSDAFPGTAYADLDIIPGTYHYYGIYMMNQGVWNRAGLASCLPPFNYASGARMFSLLPEYFQETNDTELTQLSALNQTLAQYLNVIGWGMDYLLTQYNMLASHLNDPMYIPLGDLMDLAGELGLPFQPEIPAALTRKAVANWTHVSQERGTPGGIAEQITLLTGYGVDLRSGLNLMLEQDQSLPADPAATAWNTGVAYVSGNLVTYRGFLYTCISPGALGNSPTGTIAANTWWQVVRNTTDAADTLDNTATVGGVSTWEGIYPGLDDGGSYSPPSGTLVGTVGLPDPLSMTSTAHNAFSVFNKSGSTEDMALRSVSRLPSDMTGSNSYTVPDQLQAVKDGIPVPWVTPGIAGWDQSVRYATDTIVILNGVLYQALRASTGAVPPEPGQPLNQNYGFESGVTPWTASNGATVAQSATEAFQGTYSMKITPNGTTASPGAVSETIDVIPGAIYVASGWVWCGTASQSAEMIINWYDPYGVLISASDSAVDSLTASTWTEVAAAAYAPASAATCQVVVQLTGTPASSVVSYWDDVDLSCSQTPEWCVLSPDNRLRMMVSGYTAQSFTTSANQQVEVIPFIEWYDSSGYPIISNGEARVFSRAASAGVAGVTPGVSYDSFSIGNATLLNGRETDTQDQPWTTLTGAWSVSAFADGSVYPAVAGTRSFAVLTGTDGTTGSPVYVGVTFVTAPESGQDSGIVFRAASTSSYWRAGMSGLYKVTTGSSVLSGSYSTACLPGDRLTVKLAGSVITVYRNNVQVYTVTDSYNSTSTLHGIVCEATGV
jgi:Carbohydrate binding domain